MANTIGIIADDLTGANDTALQFHLKGCNTQILFDYDLIPEGQVNTKAWAISTQTRNIDAKTAYNKVYKTAKTLMGNLKIDYLYKKIDSTLRGNIGPECLAVLDALDWDAAIIVPAFPNEGRITVGGYHLLKGVPLERTEVARDPGSPIYESHIPSLISRQVETSDIVAHIQLMTVMKGAGPILLEIQNLVKKGKRLIIVDAVSTTDLEQISLATEKCSYDLLPVGSAGLAQALTKTWLSDTKHQNLSNTIPSIPVLVVAGSATNLTRVQIKRIKESDEIEPYIMELKPEEVLSIEPTKDKIDKIAQQLKSTGCVIVHSIPLEGDISQTLEFAKQEGLNLDNLHGRVSDYLAKLTSLVNQEQNFILVVIGGETSYKCCNSIGSRQLQLIDEVDSAIPLCLDLNAQWIVTKSGNLGTPNTLINILKYFQKHQSQKIIK
ncbi:MAG: four-carbon acid sugar kinase family protein [bacterium]